MAAKFVVVLALVVAGQCSVVPVVVGKDYSSFAYGVADPQTGDFKSQVETRVGSTVSGQYSLLDADGTKRTVDYAADDLNGFNAVVRKDPVAFANVAPAVYSAPIYSSPIISRSYLAPSIYRSYPYSAGYVAGSPLAYTAPLTYW